MAPLFQPEAERIILPLETQPWNSVFSFFRCRPVVYRGQRGKPL